MNLVSCDSCGVVLDANKLGFPDDIYNEDGEVDATRAVWKNRAWLPCVPCPVCNSPITEEGK